jgi:hypothetical protein
LAWTEDDLTKLENAMKLGLEEVQFGDRKQKFRSLKEMERLRRTMKKELGLLTGGLEGGQRLVKFSKGIE